MAFGAAIKRLREKSKLSAQAFADQVGISAVRLRKWEERDLNPRYEDAQVIEKYYGKTLEEIAKLEFLPIVKIIPKTESEAKREPHINKIPIETINDTARSLIVLSDANKEACISSKEASIANRILAENQRELIAMLKSGSSFSLGGLMTGQNLADIIHPYLHVLAEGGVKVGIWADQVEAQKILGKLLSGLPKENIV